MGIGLFWLISSVEYNRRYLVGSFLISAIIQAFLGIWQFFTQSSFASKWLGMALHDASDLGTSVIQIIGSDGFWQRWLRAYGGLDHPNILGGLLGIGVFVSIISIVK